MSDGAAPLSLVFQADLDRMAAADLADAGMAGALHLGDPATQRPARASAAMSGPKDPVSLLEVTWERLADDVDTVRAWAYVDHEGADRAANESAQEIARAGSRGPLHGVPVGVKDIIDVAGMPTGAGSMYFADGGPGRHRVATTDAGVVSMLRRAGAVLVGKTHTHEFAFGGTTPPTRNPHDLDRIPGGSSGGSAAAVAAGHVPLALGTDTGGSVRIPSAYCGTAGLVPSPGLLPSDGVMPLAWSMDRVGLITANVTDLVGASQALGLVGDVTPVDWAGLRIGVPSDAFWGAVDEVVISGIHAVLAKAEHEGAALVDVDVPHQNLAVVAGLTLILAEGAEEQRERRSEAGNLFGGDVRAMLAMADRLDAALYVRAQRVRTVIRRELLEVLSDVDLLATPTMPNVAPLANDISDGQLEAGGIRIGIADAHLRYNIGANLAALPCATQPLLHADSKLPVGLQWVGAPGHDNLILAAMLATEQLD
ncbi:MAG: amidase [Antricoccus sp.]